MSRLILASRSAVRAEMLRKAGLPFEILPAAIDEAALIETMRQDEAQARDIADALAELKAKRVSNRRPTDFVIGADQVLSLDGEIFMKATTREAAARHLSMLSGRTHQLHSAVCIAHSGRAVWRFVDSASLTLRYLSSEAIERYLDEAGAAALDSVGAYQIEGLGIRLMSRIEGDYFTILGLPLLALLQGLRELGVLAS